MIDLEREEHRQKLEVMLGAVNKYRVYSSLVRDAKIVKQALDRTLKDKIQVYITKMTNWRISRKQTISPVVEIYFGELFVTMKYGSQAIRVKLEEIENT